MTRLLLLALGGLALAASAATSAEAGDPYLYSEAKRALDQNDEGLANANQGVNAYNDGRYEEAIGHFKRAEQQFANAKNIASSLIWKFNPQTEYEQAKGMIELKRVAQENETQAIVSIVRCEEELEKLKPPPPPPPPPESPPITLSPRAAPPEAGSTAGYDNATRHALKDLGASVLLPASWTDDTKPEIHAYLQSSDKSLGCVYYVPTNFTSTTDPNAFPSDVWELYRLFQAYEDDAAVLEVRHLDSLLLDGARTLLADVIASADPGDPSRRELWVVRATPGKPLLAGRCVGPAGDGNAALAMMSSLRWNGEPTVGTRAPGAALGPNSTRRKPAGFSPQAVTNATHGVRFNLPSEQWREYSSASKSVDYQHRFAESLGFIAVGIGKAAWTESDLSRPLLEDKSIHLDYVTRDAIVTLSEDTVDGARVRVVRFCGNSAERNRLPKRGAYAMRYVEGKPPVGILCLTSADPAFTDEQILATVKSLRWADEGATH